MSDGCKHCYAETTSKRNPRVLGIWGDQGTRVLASEQAWDEPYQWNEAASHNRTAARVFCASLADVFEGWPGQLRTHKGEGLWAKLNDVDEGTPYLNYQSDMVAYGLNHARKRLFSLINDTTWLTWQLLTKRSENLHDQNIIPIRWVIEGWPSNIHIGVSVENQQALVRRMIDLSDVPARVRFLSCEPLLGPLDLEPWLSRLEWVIIGGESGSNARPCYLRWIRSIIFQCKTHNVPVFVKQLGSNALYEANSRHLSAHSKGGDMIDWPLDLQVREFPKC